MRSAPISLFDCMASPTVRACPLQGSHPGVHLFAAERGHRVTLAEASDRPGGQFRVPARREQPRRAQILDLIDWYERQLAKLRVVVRLDAPMEPEEAEGFDADVVVLATGSQPAGNGRQRGLPTVERRYRHFLCRCQFRSARRSARPPGGILQARHPARGGPDDPPPERPRQRQRLRPRLARISRGRVSCFRPTRDRPH